MIGLAGEEFLEILEYGTKETPKTREDHQHYLAKGSAKRTIELVGYLQSLPAEERTEEWLSLLMQNEWNHLIDHAKHSAWRPEVEWLYLVKGNVNKVLGKFQIQKNYDIFISAVTKRCWEYFWRELIPTQIDNSIHTIKRLGGPWLRKHDELISIQTELRKITKHRPKKKNLYTQKRYHAQRRDELARDLIEIFDYHIKDAPRPFLKYISALLMKLRIEEGTEKQVYDRIRRQMDRRSLKRSEEEKSV